MLKVYYKKDIGKWLTGWVGKKQLLPLKKLVVCKLYVNGPKYKKGFIR